MTLTKHGKESAVSRIPTTTEPRAKRFMKLLALIIVAATALWAVSPLGERLKQQSEIRALKEEKQALVRENRKLKTDILKLKKDPARIEWLARKNLGLIKGDEEAYVVIDRSAGKAVKKKPKKAAGLPATVEKWFMELFK